MEGMDGSGKSTVAEHIGERLRAEGRDVLILPHPNRDTRVGRMGHRLLQTEGKPALVMAIVFYVMDVLRSLCIVKRGGHDDYVFVRYSMAVAYLPDDLCVFAYRVIERILPTPDLKLIVDVDSDVAMGRIRSRGEDLEVFETGEKLAKVRRRMLSISDGWVIVDNNGDLAHLLDQVDAVELRSSRSHPSTIHGRRPLYPVHGNVYPWQIWFRKISSGSSRSSSVELWMKGDRSCCCSRVAADASWAVSSTSS